MRHFANDIRLAVDAEAKRAALGLALAVPDIAGDVAQPGRRSSERYKEWWNAWVAEQYRVGGMDWLSGGDAYALRCAFLHNGLDDICEQRAREVVTRFRFVGDHPIIHIHNNRIGDRLQLQIGPFCRGIADALDRFVDYAEKQPDLMTAMTRLIEIDEIPLDGPFRI